MKPHLPPGYTEHNAVKLIHGGREYFSLLEKMIDSATESVHLQVYIFEEDDTGQMVAEALMRAAQRNVETYLLVDGYASQSLSKKFIKKIREAGVHFRWFEPLIKSSHFYFGRRLHHKVTVIDGVKGLVGGVNISNRYNDLPGEKAWLDWGIYVEGEASAELYDRCVEMWKRSAFTRKRTSFIKPEIFKPTLKCLVRVRSNDWIRRKKQITKSYIEMFNGASSQIMIMSSYFLPGREFRKRIRKAVARGVNIKLILAGVSDVPLVKHAERHMSRRLLQKGVEIYEYQKNILHGKLAICDDEWMTIGSYNVNNLSAYMSIELNLDVRNETIAGEAIDALEKIIQNDCKPITEKEINGSKFLTRLTQRSAYIIFRILFFLFSFYIKPEEPRRRKK